MLSSKSCDIIIRYRIVDMQKFKCGFTMKDYTTNERNLDEYYMNFAIKSAEKAFEEDEVPVGAVIVCDDKIISQAYNRREGEKNALRHAELMCIEQACSSLGGWRLHKCTLYVTLEPCPMCAGAIVNSRIKRVVFGAYDSRAGAFGSLMNFNSYPLNHKPEVCGGVCETQCRDLMQKFFTRLRDKRKK